MGFEQRHLTALYAEGLITELPYELGAFPVIDGDQKVQQELIDWNIVDPTTRTLTPTAKDFLAGITNYEWAISGLLLLYSERQPIALDIPEELMQMGIQYAVRDIPRVGFLIGYRNNTLTTLAKAGGKLSICVDEVTRREDPAAVNKDIAQIILNLCDPQKQWPAYPMPQTAIPASTAHSLRAGRPEDPDARARQIRDARKMLREAKMARPTSDALAELMNCENVATAQVGLTVRTPTGKSTAMHNALGLMFFKSPAKSGMVVSYPRRSIDGRGWITYESATLAAIGRGIAAIRQGFSADNAPVISI